MIVDSSGPSVPTPGPGPVAAPPMPAGPMGGPGPMPQPMYATDGTRCRTKTDDDAG